MNDTIKQISDLIDALPEAVQMVVYDGPLDKELADIADKYQISEIDLEKIKGEVLLVIIALNKPETLEQTLGQTTSVDKQNIKKVCDEIIQKIISPLAAERTPETHPDKDTILRDIENPAPIKPIVVNPAGANPILDAQHNLPEGERRVEIGAGKPATNSNISSSAVQSRGPLIGNLKADPYRESLT